MSRLAAPSRDERRPVSRRLMLALFVLMIVPVCGWYFIGDLASQRLLAALPEASHELLLAVQHEIRFKLALTLGIAIVVLGGVILFVRRTLLDPLEQLADQARHSDRQPWQRPPEAERPDEVGDLARALDSSLTRLMQRADEAERFAANLSHELRSPLAAIRGAGELLGEEQLPAEERRRFAANVVAESQRLERLAAGLLALARADTRAAEVRQPLELQPLVERLVGLQRPQLERAKTSIEVVAEHPAVVVHADADTVARVLTIVLENAVQHTPPGGSVGVTLDYSDSHALVTVADSGDGVPAAERERIFDRWYALSTVSRQGSGLGLAIARSLVEGMGGEISVAGSQLGGAAFSFSLPLWDAGRD